MSDATQILHAIDSGDGKAAAEPLPLVYQDLLDVAPRRLLYDGRDFLRM